MKQKTTRRKSAFTLIEMCVVIVVLALLATGLYLGGRPKQLPDNRPLRCSFNLKQIGVTYRIWAEDNGGLMPSGQTVALGGWQDLLTNAGQGANCWKNYAAMTNNLGQDPRLLLCPADERIAATNFSTDFKDNTHLSYFVGVGANRDYYPQSIQGGDRNLGPGAKPGPDYGYSPENSQGNDAAVPLSGPVSWSLKMHSNRTNDGAGLILLGDGSTFQTRTANLTRNFLHNAQDAGNWPANHIPASPSIRLVFP